MKILSGRSNRNLAKKLADNMGLSYIETYIKPFDDGELKVRISEDLYGKEIVILQSTSKPVNDHLMELLLLIDATKRAGAKSIIVIIPYFGYGRQDRRFDNCEPISASLVASLLDVANLKHIITVDLHSYQAEGFFKTAVSNLDPILLFAPKIESYKNPIIIAPDIGGVIRARKFSKYFNIELAIINKSRDVDNKCHVHGLIGDVRGRDCLIIDDIIDSAETLSKGTDLLIKHGASSVNAFVTHAVLSAETAQNRLDNSIIQNIYITDTIDSKKSSVKFHELSIVKLLANALEKQF